jgi:hypothetical protein
MMEKMMFFVQNVGNKTFVFKLIPPLAQKWKIFGEHNMLIKSIVIRNKEYLYKKMINELEECDKSTFLWIHNMFL